jgi:hypothetical protein
MAPKLWGSALLFLSSQVSLGAAPALNAEAFKPVIAEYLRDKGHLCLGKFSWPIAVSEQERQAGTKDARQMPILEKHGLVVASSAGPAGTQYELSESGRKYYLAKRTVTRGPGDAPVVHPGDVCGATLELDQVIKWQTPEVIDGHPQTTVKFTYRIVAPADWIVAADTNQVFPMVHKILTGAGWLQLEQAFAWSDDRWVAVVPD